MQKEGVYRFSDEELINSLLMKVTGQQLPSSFIWVQHCDLYGTKPPWEVFNFPINQKEGEVIVFTRLKRRSIGTIDRSAGCWRWHCKTVKEILDSKTNKLIGFKRLLTFYGEDSRNKNAQWTMHEYSLAGDSLDGQAIDLDYVVCRVAMKETARPNKSGSSRTSTSMEGTKACDEELIKNCLLRKVNGHSLPLPFNSVQECDLYGTKAPWELFSLQLNQDKKVLVFTKLKRRTDAGPSVTSTTGTFVRIAGPGRWLLHVTKSILERRTGKLIGFRKRYSYISEEDSRNENGKWSMHEYSLGGDYLDGESISRDYVLCKIKKKETSSSIECSRQSASPSPRISASEEETQVPDDVVSSTTQSDVWNNVF